MEKYLYNYGLKLIDAGINPIPSRDKIPVSSWKKYQSNQITKAEFTALAKIAGINSIGIIPKGDGIEVIDIDLKNDSRGRISDQYVNAIRDQLPQLYKKLVIEDTPSKGLHIIYKCNTIRQNIGIAFDESGKKIIEIKNNGGFIRTYPTQGYNLLQNNFFSIPTITPQERESLLNIARSFNRKPKPQPKPQRPAERPKTTRTNGRLSEFDKVALLIEEIERRRIDITPDHQTWISAGFSLATEFEESGRDFYHRISQFYPGYDYQETDKQYTDCLKADQPGRPVTINTFYKMTKEAGIYLKDLLSKPPQQPQPQNDPYSITLKPGEYLSHHNNQLIKLYQSGITKIDIKSGTGTGKTGAFIGNFSGIINLSTRLHSLNKCKTLFVVSLNSKAEKDAHQYGLPYVTGELINSLGGADAIRKALEENVILVNQHALPKVAKQLFERGERINTIIDESQTLPTGATYKGKVVPELWDWVSALSETITLLSATPVDHFLDLGFRRVNVTREQETKTNLIVRTRHKNEELTVLNHIKTADLDNKRIIFKIQSKNKIRQIKRYLKKQGLKANEILCFYSDKSIKESKEYKKFIEASSKEESFAAEVKIILTTSFINEGLDIYSKYDIDLVNIERNRTFDFKELLQFFGRHRTNRTRTVYSYHPQDNDPKEYKDLSWLFKDYVEAFEELANKLNAIQKKGSANFSREPKLRLITDLSSETKYLYYSEEENEFTVNYCAIMAFCEEEQKKYYTVDNVIPIIRNQHPNYAIRDQRSEELTEDKESEQLIKEEREKERQEKLKAQSEYIKLYHQDKESLFVAIAEESQDIDRIKKKVKNLVGDKITIWKMKEDYPHLFDTYLDQGERLIRNYNKFKELIPIEDLPAILFDNDKFRTPEKLANIHRKITISLSLDLLQHEKDGQQLSRYGITGKRLKAFNLPQLREVRRYEKIVIEVEKLKAKKGNRLSAEELTAVVIRVYRNTKGLQSWTRRKAMKLINALFITTRPRDIYVIGERRDFTSAVVEHIPEYSTSLDKFQNFTKKVSNLFKINGIVAHKQETIIKSILPVSAQNTTQKSYEN